MSSGLVRCSERRGRYLRSAGFAWVLLALGGACSSGAGRVGAADSSSAPMDGAAGVEDAAGPPEDTGGGPPGWPVAISELVWSQDGGPGDWVELVNRSDGEVSLLGWQLRDEQDGASHRFDFPDDARLAAGAYLVVYGKGAAPAGDARGYPFGLGRSDALRLFDPGGVLVDGTSWVATDFGPGASWGRCGDDPGRFGPLEDPTPGAGNAPCRVVESVSPVLNELILNEVGLTGADAPGFVEVRNRGDVTVALESCVLLLREGDCGEFVFRAGGRLEPGAFALVSAAQFTTPQGLESARYIGSDGRVSLYAPDGRLLDDTDWEREAGLSAGDAWGRCPASPGTWARLAAPTPGASNAACAPFLPPAVVLNEVLGFTPADGAIELLNRGDVAAALDGWGVTSERDGWEAPAGTSLAPGEFLVVPAPNLQLGSHVELLDAQSRLVDATKVPERVVGLGDAWGRCPSDPSEFGRIPTRTPGTANAPCEAWRPPPVVINEATWASPRPADWVELHNAGTAEVALGGWRLHDSGNDRLSPAAFVFPEEARLAAGGYLLLHRHDSDGPGDLVYAFGLRPEDTLSLYDDALRLVDQIGWGRCQLRSSMSWGRPLDGGGEAGPLAAPTPGARNSDACPCCLQTGPMECGTYRTVVVGESGSCAIRTDGSIACWGAFEPPTEEGPYARLDMDDGSACALGTSGGLVCWPFAVALDPGRTYVDVAVGHFDACAVDGAGEVSCWRWNDYPYGSPAPLPAPPPGPFAEVTVGGSHACGLRPGGAVECWGAGAWTRAPSGQFTQVAAGGDATCAIAETGMLACWGPAWLIGDPEGVGVADLPAPAGTFASLGRHGSCGVRTDGSVACWGWEQPYGPDSLRIESPLEGVFLTADGLPGPSGRTCAVGTDGSISCAGDCYLD